MDINIDNPVRLFINVIEFDEKVPSIKLLVDVLAEKFGCSVSVNTTCWVECAVFDSFVGLLRSGQTALISDMSSDFSLVVDVERGKLAWSYGREDVNGNVVRAGGEDILAEGAQDQILLAFENYPKWW